jgi:hypothetical protein
MTRGRITGRPREIIKNAGPNARLGNDKPWLLSSPSESGRSAFFAIALPNSRYYCPIRLRNSLVTCAGSRVAQSIFG